MEQLYNELYIQMNAYWDKHKGKIKNGLSLHVPMVGSRYLSNQKVRLLWIGRAINGWDDANFFNLPIEEYCNKVTNQFHDCTRFSWLDGYNYRRSAFWRVGKLVNEQLIGNELPLDWYNDITWTNLYVVAPVSGGNPNGSLIEAQKHICGQLLKKQIQLLQPTHIVFVTNWDWFSDFNQPSASCAQLFPGVNRIDVIDSPIAGQGFIEDTPVVIAKRPEYHFADQLFAKAVIEAFSQIK